MTQAFVWVEEIVMLLRRFYIFPKLDQVPETQSLLEERVSTNPDKLRGVLSTLLGGKAPVFVLTNHFESFDEFEKSRQNVSPATRQFLVKVASLSLSMPDGQFFEPIVRANEPSNPKKWVQRTYVHPLQGHVAEVRQMLEDFAKGEHEDGRPLFSLSTRVFGGDGPVFAMRDTDESLSEFDAVRSQRRARVQTLTAKLDALCRAPISGEFREVLARYANHS